MSYWPSEAYDPNTYKRDINACLMKNDINGAAEVLRRLYSIEGVIKRVPVLGPSRWRDAMNSSENVEYGAMQIAIQYMHRRPTLRRLFIAYENNEDVRRLVDRLHNATGKNRVPYLHVAMLRLYRTLNLPFDTIDDVIALARDPRVHPLLDQWSQGKGLKHYFGATNSVLRMYDWILSHRPARPDLQAIAEAEVRVDFGGGYMTGHISKLLGAEFTSYDLLDPKTVTQELMPHGGESDLRDAAAAQWVPYDVIKDPPLSFPGKKVALVSFGFLTSSVSTPVGGNSPDAHIPETVQLAGARSVASIMKTSASAYIYTYSRATKWVAAFPIIHMKAEGGVVVDIRVVHDLFAKGHIPGSPWCSEGYITPEAAAYK